MQATQLVKRLWLVTLASLVAALVIAAVYRAFTERWPSAGYWGAMAFVYVLVNVQAAMRGSKDIGRKLNSR